MSAAATLTVLIFLRTDCPVANRMAPEIARVAQAFQGQAQFWLVYPDDAPAAVERHRREYALPIPLLPESERELAKLAGATMTPEAAVFQDRRLMYRGRVDDSQASLGVARGGPARKDLEAAIRRALAGQRTRHTKAIGCALSRPGV